MNGLDRGGDGFQVTEIDEKVAKTLDIVPVDGVKDLRLEIGRDVVRSRFNDSDLHAVTVRLLRDKVNGLAGGGPSAQRIARREFGAAQGAADQGA